MSGCYIQDLAKELARAGHCMDSIFRIWLRSSGWSIYECYVQDLDTELGLGTVWKLYSGSAKELGLGTV